MKKLFSILMAITICLAVISVSFAADVPSDWAEQDVSEAIYRGFVPSELQTEYTADITRQEFAKTAIFYLAASQNLSIDNFINIYSKKSENLTGVQIVIETPFTDIDDYYINCAYALGVISGRGNGIFDPNSQITRQEAAVMLLNAYRLFGMYANQEKAFSFGETFTDSGLVADWAIESVRIMYQFGVMNGVSSDMWNPLAYYTREQCFTTFLRLYNNGPSRSVLLPYDEALARMTTSEYDFLSLEITNRIETIYITVLVRVTGGLPRGSSASIVLLNKPGSPAGEGGIIYLPTPNNSYANPKQPDEIWLSEDEMTLYYSYHYDEPLTLLVSEEGEYEVIREAGTHIYTVNLTTGIATVVVEPLK